MLRNNGTRLAPLRWARMIFAVSAASAVVLGGTLSARAVILDDPQVEHFITCFGYMLHDQQAHHDQCWPYKGPVSNDSAAGGSFAPGAVPTVELTMTVVPTTVFGAGS